MLKYVIITHGIVQKEVQADYAFEALKALREWLLAFPDSKAELYVIVGGQDNE